MTKEDYTRIPDKKVLPYSYDKWRRLGILKASPLERLLMLELSSMFDINDWLFGNRESTWEIKDMRLFVKDLAKKFYSLPITHRKKK